jgi:hypothetical protein
MQTRPPVRKIIYKQEARAYISEQMPRGKPLKKAENAALKALITIYGPREAARRAGLPAGTVMAFAYTHKIKKATGFKQEDGDVSKVLADNFAKDREETALNLATYTRKASKKASEHSDPLEVARKVRDVAGVYSILWPPGEESELIEGAILVGGAQPTTNPEEVQARAIEIPPDDHVRSQLPDQRPAGD